MKYRSEDEVSMRLEESHPVTAEFVAKAPSVVKAESPETQVSLKTVIQRYQGI